MNDFCLIGDKTVADTEVNFYSTDSEELYQTNIKRIPNWIWKDIPIIYKWNSLGYRSKQFEEINKLNYGIVAGCSNTVGVGVPKEKTFAGLIESNLYVDIMNIAKTGASNEFIFFNVLHMLDKLKTTPPKFVVINWTYLNRMLWFKKTDDVEWLFHWTPNTPGWPLKNNLHATTESKISEMHLLLDNDYHINMKYFYYRKTIRLIANTLNIKLIEFTYDHMQDRTRIHYINNSANNINQRFGRDMQVYDQINPTKSGGHPGTGLHQETFNYINLCLK